jgi:VanZ family protein
MIALIKTYWLALTLFTLAAITCLSLWPVANLPEVPGSDKTHHFIAYALLILPTALRKPNHWLIIGLLMMGYSGAIELIQPYVNRYGEWLDMAANTVGLVFGVVLAQFIAYIFPLASADKTDQG